MSNRSIMALPEIYRQVRKTYANLNQQLPPNDEEAIRGTLQTHCATSAEYKKLPVEKRPPIYFKNPKRGFWSCEVPVPPLADLL